MRGLKPRDLHKYLKSFMSGSAIPAAGTALIIPLVYTFTKQAVTLAYMGMLPFVWGLWNVIFEASKRPYNIGYHGLLIGFAISIFDVLSFGTAGLCGLVNGLEFILLFAEPLIYYFVWYYGVEWLNKLVGLR